MGVRQPRFLGPLRERQVGRDHERCPFTSLRDHLEQKLGADIGERHVSELVDESRRGRETNPATLLTRRYTDDGLPVNGQVTLNGRHQSSSFSSGMRTNSGYASIPSSAAS